MSSLNKKRGSKNIDSSEYKSSSDVNSDHADTSGLQIKGEGMAKDRIVDPTVEDIDSTSTHATYPKGGLSALDLLKNPALARLLVLAAKKVKEQRAVSSHKG